MTVDDARTLAATMRACEDEGRWTPAPAAAGALNGLERQLSVSIQAGQPELEAMRARMISACGDALGILVRADHAACRIASPTLDELRLLGANVVVHDFRRAPSTAPARAA